MRLLKYSVVFYHLLFLSISAFGTVHYDHGIEEIENSHLCFENISACLSCSDGDNAPHNEESLWEHLFEDGCVKTASNYNYQVNFVYITLYDPLPPIVFTSWELIPFEQNFQEILFIRYQSSRAPPQNLV